MHSSPFSKNTSAFKASKLNASTFLIIEYKDIYDEQPFIYAKVDIQSNTILIIDTGCGGATDDPNVDLKDLRESIETFDVDDNNGKPINEGGRMKYIVVLSHCHYDHICRYQAHASLVYHG